MEPTTSKYIEVQESSIHSKGVFAAMDIPDETEIIEYVGEQISKKEADKRADQVLVDAQNHKHKGAVYIFELNKKTDIDGNVEYNTARFINHSCDPNCEAVNIDGEIWICATRDIKKGEELTYNYGYSHDEDYEEHPCRCGSENCVGYILDEEHWGKLIRDGKLKVTRVE